MTKKGSQSSPGDAKSDETKTGKSNPQVITAVITGIVTVAVAFIGYLQVISPTREAIKATQTAVAFFATQTVEANATSIAFAVTLTAVAVKPPTPNSPTNLPVLSGETPTSIPPIATSIPPTDTPVLATDTATTAPPTNTPIPLTATPTPTTIPSTSMPIPPTTTPTIVPPTNTPPLTPAPNFSGKLAIPVMYGLQHKIYIAGLDGKGVNGPQPVSLTGSQPMFSHDGQILIVNGTEADFSGVYVTNVSGQNPKILIDRDSAHWPVLSPNASEVIFVEETLANRLSKRKSNGEIFGFQINNRPILATHVLWTDDNRLVFQGCATWLDRPSECGTWISSADNLNPVRIVEGNDYWPMDAKNNKVVFISAKDGDWDIYLLSLESRKLENITDNNYQDGLPAIAPDGRSVAYISNESGQWALWTVELSNKEKRKWFNIDPERGTIDVNNWAGERMSWAK